MPDKKEPPKPFDNTKADAEWKELTEATVAAVGRPTLYDVAFCEEVVKYFVLKPPYRTVNTMFGPKLVPNDLPTLVGFAIRIGVCKKTINNWCDDHPEFLRAVEIAKTVQEHIGATNSLHKLYDKSFSIFFGKNNLGYVERVEQVVTTKDAAEDLMNKLFDKATGKPDTAADVSSASAESKSAASAAGTGNESVSPLESLDTFNWQELKNEVDTELKRDYSVHITPFQAKEFLNTVESALSNSPSQNV